MFYMEDYLTVKTGEEIFGTIGMRPNAKNNVRRGWRRAGWGAPVPVGGSQGLSVEVSLSTCRKRGPGDPVTMRLNRCPPGAPVLSTGHSGVGPGGWGPEGEPLGFLPQAGEPGKGTKAAPPGHLTGQSCPKRSQWLRRGVWAIEPVLMRLMVLR